MKYLRCHRSVYRPRHRDWFAHVNGLEVGEFVEVLFDEFRYAAQNLCPGVDIEAWPGALIERGAGSRDGRLDIAFGCLRNRRDL